MANSIKIKRSSVPAKVPLTTDLALGELAINTYDGKLYLKMDDGTPAIVTVNAGGGGSGDVVGPGSSTDNAITRFNGTTGKLIQNSTATLDDSGVISVSGANISGLTASSAVATDASKNLVSVANTGTGDNVLSTSPTLITPALGTPSALVGTNISGTASGLSIGGNAATVTNGVYTTDTGTVTNTMLAGSIANNKLVNSAITINGTSTSLGGSISVGTVTSVTGTSPISSSGGATPDISISAAGTSTSGYLSSTDWNTFNNKGSGSVTSVSGTGTVSGISLSGTVTTTGSLTLGGSLDLSSPPTIGNTAANTGAFTTLSASGHTTFEGVTSTGATGTGKLVYDGSPTLATPNLGTPSALVATNASGTAASLTAGAATVLATARDIAGVSFNGSASINIPITNLSDVSITAPTVNQLLGYNGTHWANTNAVTASAGKGVVLYNATPIITAAGTGNAVAILSLPSIPVTTAEQTVSGSATSNTVEFSAFVTEALGRTIIDAGVWDFTTFTGVTLGIGASATLTRQVYTAIPFVTGTVTTTGTGTTRTATASAGTPFSTSAIVASSTNTDASYLQTPNGLYQISVRTSDTVVTIVTPTGYTNESAVAGTVWKKIFGITTPDITYIYPTIGQIDVLTTQPSYAITAATKIGILGFVTASGGVGTATIYITYNGTTRNTHVNSPLANLHNDLAGLNGGTSNEYYHSTAAEYTGTGTGVFVRATSPTLVTPALGTPTALVGTNISGTATAFTASNVTTNANLTGEVTSTGNATTVTNAAVIAKVLTGYVSGAGTVAATDNILQAVQKLNGNILAVPGTVTSVGFTGGIVSVATATTTPALTVAGTSGGIPYFSTGTTWATSTLLAASSIMLGGGAGAAPTTTTTGTGVVSALGINPGTAGSFVVNGGALGTPSAGVLTNATGTATGLTAGTATTANGVAAGVVAGKMIYDQFTATASQTTFTTSATYISGKIEVYANGVKMVNAADVTVTSGTSVVFATGVALNTRVDLVYPT